MKKRLSMGLAVGVLLAASIPGIAAGQSSSSSAVPAEEPVTPAASTDPAASAAPAISNPYDAEGAIPGSGKGKRIGYFRPGPDFARFPNVKLIMDSIEEQAAIAGVTLSECAAGFTCPGGFGKGLLNGRKVKAAAGVIAFDIAPLGGSLCSVYKSKPTIAIGNSQPPCEVALMGPDDHEAGRLGGAAMGRYAKDNWDCDITAYVSLESPASPENADRMGGFRDGFGESCPIDPATEVVLDVQNRPDLATELVSELLPTLPGDRVVVVAFFDYIALAALDAARTLGREGDLFFASLGGDESFRKEVACDPQVVASVAYYWERFGRTVVPAMLDILAGKEVPERLFTVHEVLDATNIRDIYPDTPAC